MTKKMRQQIILNIIKAKTIFNLSDLLAAVKKQKCQADISTLSRDMAELGVVKTPKGYRVLTNREDTSEVLPSQVSTLQQMITGIKSARNLIVIYTTSGGASAVARWLDLIPNSGLIGTIAGDDTILGIAQNDADARKFISRLSNTIENRKVLKMESFLVKR